MCYASPRNVTAKRSENDGVAKCCSNVRVMSDVRRGEAYKKGLLLCTFKAKTTYGKSNLFLKKDDRWWKATQRYQPLFIFFFQIYSLTRTVNELLEYKRLKSNFLFDTVVENRTKKSHFLKVRMPPPRIWEGAVRYGRRAIRGDHSFLFIFKYILSGWCQG